MELPSQNDFEFYDVNHDGTLTLKEWDEIETRAMMEEVEANKQWLFTDFIMEIGLTFLFNFVHQEDFTNFHAFLIFCLTCFGPEINVLFSTASFSLWIDLLWSFTIISNKNSEITLAVNFWINP